MALVNVSRWLTENEEQSVNSDDIKKLLKGQVRILTNRDLNRFNSIEDALGKYGAIAHLYLTNPKYGHWTAIFKRKNKSGKTIIEFFDPYSLPVDSELDYIGDGIREETNTVFPKLSELLYKSPHPIEYNDHKFQKFGHHISTCGRWVIARLLFRDLTLEEFYKLFKPTEDIDSDKLVTAFTMMQGLVK